MYCSRQYCSDVAIVALLLNGSTVYGCQEHKHYLEHMVQTEADARLKFICIGCGVGHPIVSGSYCLECVEAGDKK